MQEYKEHKKPIEANIEENALDIKKDIEFSAEILTSGHWPNQEGGTVKIPA